MVQNELYCSAPGVKGRAELHASTNTSNVAHILLPGLSYFLTWPFIFSYLASFHISFRLNFSDALPSLGWVP